MSQQSFFPFRKPSTRYNRQQHVRMRSTPTFSARCRIFQHSAEKQAGHLKFMLWKTRDTCDWGGQYQRALRASISSSCNQQTLNVLFTIALAGNRVTADISFDSAIWHTVTRLTAVRVGCFQEEIAGSTWVALSTSHVRLARALTTQLHITTTDSHSWHDVSSRSVKWLTLTQNDNEVTDYDEKLSIIITIKIVFFCSRKKVTIVLLKTANYVRV